MDPQGAVIAYDRPSSFLAALGRPEVMEIAKSLDREIDAVAARWMLGSCEAATSAFRSASR
jgi:hypothetical protein